MLERGDADISYELPFKDFQEMKANGKLNVVSLPFSNGIQYIGMNVTKPPFDNPKIRRAAFLAMNQKDVLDATVGNAKFYEICGSYFACDTPLASDVGAETLIKGNGMAEAKKALAGSGYDGTPVVLLYATDTQTGRLTPILKSLLERGGFVVDMQAMDWQTVLSRRARKERTRSPRATKKGFFCGSSALIPEAGPASGSPASCNIVLDMV